VSHQHAAAMGQTHGFGWASLSAPVEVEVDPTLPHRHFILLGIEFGALPGASERSDTRLPSIPSVDPIGDGTVAPVISEADCPVIDSPPPMLVAFAIPVDTTPALLTPRAIHSGPVTSHTRTGVLRS